MQLKYYLTLICLLTSIYSMAQREKKMEHLLIVDTANVTLRDARVEKYPYIEKIPQYDVDTVVKKRFYAGGSTEERDHYGYWNNSNPAEYAHISFNEKTNMYTLFPAFEGLVPNKAHFEFNSKLSTGWVNRLPERQSKYGQSVSPNDIFSWGEPVSTSYDPYNIFRPSFGAVNSLDYIAPLFKKRAFLVLNYANTANAGIVPKASSVTNDFKLNLVDIPFRWFFNKAQIKANYLETGNNLTENGNNYAHLFYNIATTPPDFDNSRGGYSGGKAFTNTNGSEHRYANSVDNPYRYIDNSLDEETLRKASAAFSLSNESWDWGINYDYNRQNIRSGIMPYEPNMTENANGREETFKTLNSMLQYKKSFFTKGVYDEFDMWKKLLHSTLLVTYDFNAINYNADYTHADTLALHRITNDLGILLQNGDSGYYNAIFAYKFWLNANNSNTLNKEKVYCNEGLNIAVRFDKFRFWNYDIKRYIPKLKLSYSLSQTQNEAPLYYSQPYYASTLFKAEDFRNYQEQYPLYRTSGINTEKTLRNEVGFDISFFRYKHYLTVNYFWNTTKNGIVPVYQNNRFELSNAVDWNKEGWEITYINFGHIGYELYWYVDVNFTSYKTLVKRLLVNNDQIPLAGFSDVSVSVLEGQPYGVIYGRETDGTTGVIGNPTPDFMLNVNPSLNWKGWQLGCSIGYVHGGDCWNGTRNTMNYLGVSEESAQNRTTQTPSDSPYYSKGITGIAQEAIEDASTVRFHNITLSYNFGERLEIPQLILSLGVNNLIIWSAYSGVDATRPLFGYSAAQGLDYFNMPGATTVVFAVKMKF